MEQRDSQATNKVNKVPRLSKLSKLLLIVGVFIIIMVPIAMVYRQQPVKRSEMEQELANLQKIIAVPLTEKERLQAELNKAEAVKEVAEESFPKINPGVDIVEGLFELADKSDLIITNIETELPKEDEENAYPYLIFTISITGQISKVQNFLLLINDRYPTSVIKTADIIILEGEGIEDVSVLTINISYLGETLEEDA